jgi:N-acetylglucosamine kinase-like BadF-type ATPase
VTERSSTAAVVGIDGGGTKTLTLLADAGGTVIARAQGGPSNQNVVGPDAAAATIARTMIECCRSAGMFVEGIAAGVIGLAGAGSPDERMNLLRLIGSHFDATVRERLRLRIETDARIALEGAFDGGPGIVVIAGTGSAVIAKNAEGEVRTFGGWGRVLGDEGSGYFIGREALRSLLLTCDAAGALGPLERSVAEETGLRTRDQIISAVYRDNFTMPSIAPLVLRAADAGDAHALSIVNTAAGFLADQVAIAVDRLVWKDDPGIVFTGGLIDAGGLYAGMLEAAIRERTSRARVHAPLRSPAEGAVRMARTIMGGAS